METVNGGILASTKKRKMEEKEKTHPVVVVLPARHFQLQLLRMLILPLVLIELLRNLGLVILLQHALDRLLPLLASPNGTLLRRRRQSLLPLVLTLLILARQRQQRLIKRQHNHAPSALIKLIVRHDETKFVCEVGEEASITRREGRGELKTGVRGEVREVVDDKGLDEEEEATLFFREDCVGWRGE